MLYRALSYTSSFFQWLRKRWGQNSFIFVVMQLVKMVSTIQLYIWTILILFRTQTDTDMTSPLFPTASETAKAIKLLSSGKAPGSGQYRDLQSRRSSIAEKLIIHIMRRIEVIPQEFKDPSIIRLFKRKGNLQVCDNHRGISLLSIAGKILARVLLNRLKYLLIYLPI